MERANDQSVTARDIQKRLIWDRYRRSFVIPNFTPRQWYECDVFEITPAGYFREYEIKLSISDFRADAKKCKTKFVDGPGPDFKWEETKKLACIGKPPGPVQFWYVAPVGMIKECPLWAGLIEIIWKPGNRAPFNCLPLMTKPAPRLHNEKADPTMKKYADGICYWRFMNQFLK